jgi:hypothetical protein
MFDTHWIGRHGVDLDAPCPVASRGVEAVTYAGDIQQVPLHGDYLIKKKNRH